MINHDVLPKDGRHDDAARAEWSSLSCCSNVLAWPLYGGFLKLGIPKMDGLVLNISKK